MHQIECEGKKKISHFRFFSFANQNRLRVRLYFLSRILLFSFISDTVLPNVIESQYCTGQLHLPASECLVNSTTVPQTDIQTFTSTFQMIRTSIEVTIPCVLSFFFGPWSDKYGRRPLLISSAIGKGPFNG